MISDSYAIETVGITKRFGSLCANDDISIGFERGGFHAIVGENGAGKTTLMRILYGMIRPDFGTVKIDGEAVRFKHPSDALSRGVGMIHQHFMLVDSFSALENLVLGAEPVQKGVVDWEKALEEAHLLAQKFNFEIPFQTEAGKLSVSLRQQLEIARVLRRGANILILDEPTAVLTPMESGRLLDSLKHMCDNGATVILISHRLADVLHRTDKVVVLRQGKVAARLESDTLDPRELARLLVSSKSKTGPPSLQPTSAPHLDSMETPLLVWDNRARSQVGGGSRFSVRPGESVVLLGAPGHGVEEIIQEIVGIRSTSSGTARYRGQDLAGFGPGDSCRRGLSYIPGDRLREGLAGKLSAEENLLLGEARSKKKPGGLQLDMSALRRQAGRIVHDWNITPPEPRTPAGRYSGGNQQKWVVARELSRVPELLVAEHPARGLDLAGAEQVYEAILGARAAGASVLVATADPEEALRLGHRIIVFYRHGVALESGIETARVEELALAMTGLAPSGTESDSE